jgi:hypothetical protein
VHKTRKGWNRESRTSPKLISKSTMRTHDLANERKSRCLMEGELGQSERLWEPMQCILQCGDR